MYIVKETRGELKYLLMKAVMEELRNTKDIQKTSRKLADVNPTTLIITLHVKGLNSLTESHMGCQLTSNNLTD